MALLFTRAPITDINYYDKCQKLKIWQEFFSERMLDSETQDK